jgi:hypothetical protein
MWVQSGDGGSHRLWIVPTSTGKLDKRDVYREIAMIISEDRPSFRGIDIGDIEIIDSDHPVAKGMKGMVRVAGFSSVYFSGNILNGYYLPDGVILRAEF